ncbi:FAD-dependent monooxygenase [Hoeflea poritis]|uniref:FAD-dependent monooxygenase n=1 Tax=Hoeflea poritis TaxID=2993659 RepID=A0ABT4VUZ4_9HYPH|nr:FAD-dependent monooxygenase [Hoeflea poritis]MDA4848519.1 FAD-dependent monooxygenase [Hoeflea poritis]
MTFKVETEILVVGAGPVGLALAGDLSNRGHEVTLVDMNDGTAGQPKMDMVGIRTMEYMRRWGLTERVHNAGYNRDYPQDNVFLTTMTGFEIGRQIMPSMSREIPPAQSPVTRERCPQNFFDPVLTEFAREKGAEIHYGLKYLEHEQKSDHVVAKISCLKTGETKQISAQFLVGCDGGNSGIRDELGIEMHGAGVLTYTTNVIFEAQGFNDLHDKTPGYRYMFVGPDGAWGTIVAIDGRDRWRMSIIGDKNPQPLYNEEEVAEFAYKMVGKKFDLTVISIMPWIRSELVADRYHSGRVILCGDACHRTSPTAGLGMNTGIGDAVDLAWKLSAILQGWGDKEALLRSYDQERIPIAARFTQFSTGNLNTMKAAAATEEMFKESDEGREQRRRLRKYFDEGLRREWFSLNMHLGNRYMNSDIIIYEEGEDPDLIAKEYEEAIIYNQTSRPGARAPHAWLRDGRSMIDFFGGGFVLLTFTDVDRRAAEEAFAVQAKELGIPFEVLLVDQPDIANIYDRRFVLVRPDGHVAWRNEHLPLDPSFVLEKVVGKRSSLGAQDAKRSSGR